MEKKKSIWIATAILIALALFSGLFLSKVFSSPGLHKKEIAYLTDKQGAALGMTTAAVGISIAVSATPGDMGSSIADQLAELIDVFGIALIAIFLEKYLLSLSGYVAFGWLFPGALFLVILWIHRHRKIFLSLAVKLGTFGVLLCLTVPASVRIGTVIEETYGISLDDTLASVEASASEISETIETEIATETEASSENGTEKKGNFFTGIADTIGSAANNAWDGITDAAGDIAQMATGGVTAIIDKATDSLNKLLEAAAVIIITTCIIPIVTFLILLWGIKLLTGVNVNITNLPQLSKLVPNKKKEKGTTIIE